MRNNKRCLGATGKNINITKTKHSVKNSLHFMRNLLDAKQATFGKFPMKKVFWCKTTTRSVVRSITEFDQEYQAKPPCTPAKAKQTIKTTAVTPLKLKKTLKTKGISTIKTDVSIGCINTIGCCLANNTTSSLLLCPWK